MRISSFSTQQTLRRAFTLIEVMAATTIMVIVVTLVLGLTTNVLDTWARSSGKLASNYEGRVALEIMTQDLESAVFRANGDPWFQVVYDTVKIVDTERSLPTLYFFAPVKDAPKIRFEEFSQEAVKVRGDVSAVSYRIRYQNPLRPDAAERKQLGLYRVVLDPETTFFDAMDVAYTRSSDFQYDLNDFWTNPDFNDDDDTLYRSLMPEDRTMRRDALTEHARPISETANSSPSYESFESWVKGPGNFLSANIADLSYSFYFYDAEGEVRKLPPDTEFIVGRALFLGRAPLNLFDDRVEESIRLAYVEVEITVLNDEGAKLLLASEQAGVWQDGLDFQTLIVQHGETFRRRVEFLNRPL